MPGFISYNPSINSLTINETVKSDFGTHMLRIGALLDDKAGTRSSVTFAVEVVECEPVGFTFNTIPD